MEDLILSSLEAANNNKGVEEEALLMEKPRQDWWEVKERVLPFLY